MTPYFVTIVLVASFAFAARAVRNRQELDGPIVPGELPWNVRVLLILAVTPLILTAGLRYYMGTDFGAYYNAEKVFGGHLWQSIMELNEPGLPLLVEIISKFSHDGGVYIFVFSLITVSLSTYSILKYTEDYVFALLLYVFCGLWHGSFNGVRQYLAATIVLLGHRLILERKFWKYLLTVFVAFCFHSSAAVMIVPFFVMRNRINFGNILLLTVGTMLVALNYETVFRFVGFLKEKDVVMNEYATNSVNILRVLANVAPAAFAIIMFWKKEPTTEEMFYINGLIINAAAMIAASNSAYLARVCIHTSVFLPIALPKLVHMENPRLESLFRAGTIMLFGIFWYFEVSSYSSLNNFQWIWSRA